MAREIRTQWRVLFTEGIPVVLGALGIVNNILSSSLIEIGVTTKVAFIQKSALYGTSKICSKGLRVLRN